MVLKPGVGVGLGVKICVGRLRQREGLYPFHNTCNEWHVKLTLAVWETQILIDQEDNVILPLAFRC